MASASSARKCERMREPGTVTKAGAVGNFRHTVPFISVLLALSSRQSSNSIGTGGNLQNVTKKYGWTESLWELTIEHRCGFLECPGGSAYNFELRMEGLIKHSSENVLGLRRWLPLVLFAAGLIATGLVAQASRAQRSESTQLELGKTIEGQIAGGQSQEYHLSVEAGEYVNVSVEQRSIDVTIACIGPDGKTLLAADSF